jgi:hypothetical protein
MPLYIIANCCWDPAADAAHNGLISTTDLANYLNVRLPMLTEGRQAPGMEVRERLIVGRIAAARASAQPTRSISPDRPAAPLTASVPGLTSVRG